ncbi:MAG: hypothetical protein LBC78_01515, partial [Oscillospiraceae bacterium]|nr:hypothetical protein [Oscillospiraceae bacterium]
KPSARARGGLLPLSLVDLDIVNPYFRSREKRDELTALGVSVYGGVYGKGSAAEIPELAANVRAPLENPNMSVIIDAGGNDSGANVLNQFAKYFTPERTTVVSVVNFSRFETRDVPAAAEQIHMIERITGLTVDYIVGNTHLLRETTPETLLRGHGLALSLSASLDKPLYCETYPPFIELDANLAATLCRPFPVGMFMRESWHDI